MTEGLVIIRVPMEFTPMELKDAERSALEIFPQFLLIRADVPEITIGHCEELTLERAEEIIREAALKQ